MKKILRIAVFFLLLEYQVFIGGNNYALIPAIGLILLCAYDIFFENKDFFFREQKLSEYYHSPLTLGEKIGAGFYAVIIVLSIIFGTGWSAEFAFILIAGILGVTLVSLREFKNREAQSSKSNSSWISSFTIPKIFLCLINYLLSVQIHQNIAYQSIIFLSCFVFYEIMDYSEKIGVKARSGEITQKEFKHYLFHRWSKYWNFFLGIWFFVALRANGVVNSEYEYILLFAFMVIYFTYLLRNEISFTPKDFFILVLLSALLAGLSPITSIVVGNEIPTYILASIIFIAFDIGDTYFHQREFKESNAQFWSRKAILYVLMAIYISQLHFMMTSSMYSLDQVTASVLTANKL